MNYENLKKHILTLFNYKIIIGNISQNNPIKVKSWFPNLIHFMKISIEAKIKLVCYQHKNEGCIYSNNLNTTASLKSPSDCHYKTCSPYRAYVRTSGPMSLPLSKFGYDGIGVRSKLLGDIFPR